MVLKNMLVLMDTLPHAADRLDLAIAMAKRHGAAVTALNTITHSLLPFVKGEAAVSSEQMRESFLQKTKAAGIEGTWLQIDVKVLGGSIAEVVNHYSTFADLVVVGQTMHQSAQENLVERVVLGSGKPVLVVPYTGVFSNVGERVLIAWKTGRESSRALTDALPMLRKSQVVNVFEVNPTEGEKADMEGLRAHLSRHQVQAGLETSVVTELSVADVLLNRVADEGSDLLVMGAYADLYFGSYILGDIARHVLRHMTVPVLMSH
ncbi:MAG TPA: universal stress protein UspA [Geobacter sp.]|nr:universal stress protein UspA [Geobacter sp.]